MKAGAALALIAAAALTAGCGARGRPAQAPDGGAGDRIVSLDYCADQLVLGLVPPARVAAVSPEVGNDPLFAARLAAGKPRVRLDAEQIIALRPTLVVRSYGGGPRMAATLRRAGIRVYDLPYVERLADVAPAMRQAGDALHARPAAAARISHFERQLAYARPGGSPARALYLTPGSYTTGPGTLVHDVMVSAGLTSVEQRPGWHRLALEQLVRHPPRVVVRGFFESNAHRQDHWSASGHRALAAATADARRVDLPGSWLACGNWRVGEAVAALANHAR